MSNHNRTPRVILSCSASSRDFNPFLVRSMFLTKEKWLEKIGFGYLSQSLIHQVYVSNKKLIPHMGRKKAESQSLIHQVSVSDDYTSVH